MKISTKFKCFLLLSILILFMSQYLNAQVTDTIYVESGWNLLSLPLKVLDGTKSILFPSSISDAFVYKGGYISKDTLEYGDGFWLKYDLPDTVLIAGNINFLDTIEVSAGWNIIGSLSIPILVGMIRPVEPLIIISDYFNFTSEFGYQASDTIYPGLGYWVKVNEDGLLVLSSMGIPCSSIPTLEYEGKTYNTVQIGFQCWLKENLDIGTMIQVVDSAKDNGVIEKYCYNNNTANCSTYGGLYQWNEAMQYSTTPGTRGICPSGWHIPTDAEFQTLKIAVDSDGNALKAKGQGKGAGAGTNTSGFSALLAGGRFTNRTFYGLGTNAAFWRSTEDGSMSAYYMLLNSTTGSIDLGFSGSKESGFSVRCLQD